MNTCFGHRECERKIRDALTDYFNDDNKVLIKTVEDALVVIIREAKNAADISESVS